MKLRTSFCNGAILDKNITRFSPLWLGYSVFLVVHLLSKGNIDINSQLRFLLHGKYLRIGTLFYGMICGITLFGDLFSHRRMQGLQGMPVRRECWFITNALTGLLFFLIPILLYFVATGMRSDEQNYYLIPEFLLSYGVALLCVQLSGSRISAVLLMVAAVCLPAVCRWLFVNLYHNLLSSVGVEETGFGIVQYHNVLPMGGEEISNTPILQSVLGGLDTSRDTGWIRASAGVAAMAVALLLYRFRKMEDIGRFGIIRGLRVAFAVVFALVISGMIAAKINGSVYGTYLALALLAPVFFLIGMMLAERSIRIWKQGCILALAVFMVSLFGTLACARYSIDKQKAYVPEVETVQSVNVYVNQYGYGNGYHSFVYEGHTLTAPTDIEAITQIHRKLLPGASYYQDVRTLYLTYTLKDGTNVRRYYPLPEHKQETYEALQAAVSTHSAIFGEVDWETYLQQVYYIEVLGKVGLSFEGYVFGSPEATDNDSRRVYKSQKKSMIEGFLRSVKSSADANMLNQMKEAVYTVKIYSTDANGEQRIVELTIPEERAEVHNYLKFFGSNAGRLPPWTITEDMKLEYQYEPL